MARVLPDEGRGPEYEKQLDEALDRLEALPVVKAPAKIEPQQRRVIVNMWCGRTHSGSLKQPIVKLNISRQQRHRLDGRGSVGRGGGTAHRG